MTDDELDALGRAAARGDGAAFASLCDALAEDVWRYCRAILGERELALDAAQETFVRLVRAVRRYRGDGPVRVYVLVLARRAAAQVLRRERRHTGQAVELPDRGVPDATGHVELGALLEALPEPLRQAFVLTQVTGLSYAEAAGVAGCAVGTIRSRVFRARERLVAAVQQTDEEELQRDRP